jgi:Mn-containing catalase
MAANHDKDLREHLLFLLAGGGAHLDFDKAVAKLPKKFRGAKPANVPHTPWRLLEHMRLAQNDILDFCTNPKYHEKSWPQDYWPKSDAPSEAEWEKSIDDFRRDLKRMQELVKHTGTDLFAKIPWGDGQTYLREALLVADHNAYHLGELVLVRRALGTWDE